MMQRVPLRDLYRELHRVLIHTGFPEERAALVARLFAENQRDGVYSHGLNRFADFVAGLDKRGIDPLATPEKVAALGVVEQWDGKRGVGLWNAHVAMGRAVALAREHGMGCVGLRNTNHWMRGGAYGLQAVEAGCVGICWTNTIPLMPPWGSAEVRIGNNPLVIAVPRPDGPLLLDLAMSQYSNGKLEVRSRQGRTLPVPGGYDAEGSLSSDPAAILAARRALPIGYWKGSGLAVVLDTLAAVLAGGLSSHEIGEQGTERRVSQVFIALDVTTLNGASTLAEKVNAIVDDLHAAAPLEEGEPVRYPGEGMLRTRRESVEHGVRVDPEQWQALCALGKP